MLKAFQSAASRLLGRGGSGVNASNAAAAADFDSVMKSVHEDLLAMPESQPQLQPPQMQNPAEFNLGAMYKERSRQELRQMADAALNGKGTSQSDQRAAALYTAAAMKGDADSAYSVAMMLLQGRGMPEQDAKKALAILVNLAQKARHPWACFSLAMLRLQQFRAAGYADDSTEMGSVKQLLEHAATHKVAPAALNLSNCYFKGVGTSPDPAQGLAWLRAAARLGDPVAATQLGMRLTQGLDVDADPVRGFKLFLLAAESGYLEAVHNVGGAFLMGKGAPQDDTQARAFFQLAASKGFVPSLVNLASLLQQGRGGGQDLESAARLLTAAAEGMQESDPTRAQVQEQLAYVVQLAASPSTAAEEVAHGAQLVAQLQASLAKTGALLNAPAPSGTLNSATAALEGGGAQAPAGPGAPALPASQALSFAAAAGSGASGSATAAAHEVFVFESEPEGGSAQEVLQLELKLLHVGAAQEVLDAVNGTDMSVGALDAALQPLVRQGKVALSRVRAYREQGEGGTDEKR